MSEWIDWGGGECPVAEGVLVDVRYRDGLERREIPALVHFGTRDATPDFWRNEGYKNDIVAYRLSKPENPFTVTTVPTSALDEQQGGDHYKKLGDYQPWEVLRHWLTPEEFRGYMKGEAIVYLARERSKGGDLDVNKAAHTLNALIELMGKNETKAP